METVNGEKTYDSQCVTFNLPAGTHFITISAFTVNKPIIQLNTASHMEQLDEFWPNLEGRIKKEVINNTFNGYVNIIIGQDNYWRIGLNQVIPHQNESLGLISTKLGWTMAGNMANPDLDTWQQCAKINTTKKVALNPKDDEVKRIEASLTKLFDKEEDETDKNDYTYEEKYAMENFYKNIKVTPEGRYSVVPMFKENAEPLRNNYFLALMRYRSLKRSLSNHPDRKDEYNKALKCMLDNGEIEEVKEPAAV